MTMQSTTLPNDTPEAMDSATTEPNDVQRVMAALFEPSDIVEIRPLKSQEAGEGAGPSLWIEAETVEAELRRHVENDIDGWQKFVHYPWSLYFGVNPRSAKGERGDRSVRLARSIFADLDEKDFRPENGRPVLTLEYIRQLCRDAGLPAPTVIVYSGHGWHLYWLLDQPCHDLDHWRNAQERVIKALGADPKIKNPERVMRVPGLMNNKLQAAPVGCLIKDYSPENRSRLQDFETVLPTVGLDHRNDADQEGSHADPAPDTPSVLVLRNSVTGETKTHPTEQALGSGSRKVTCLWHDDQNPSLSLDEDKGIWNCFACGASGIVMTDDRTERFGAIIPLGEFLRPDFPEQGFPPGAESVKDMCQCAAEVYQVPIDLPAMLAITIGGAALAKTCRVQINRGWSEPLNLYTATVLPPANRKSPVFRIIQEPVIAHDRLLRDEAAVKIQQVQNQRAILEERLKHLQSQAAKAKDRADRDRAAESAAEIVTEIQELPDERMPQLIMVDATPEAVAELLEANGGKVCCLSDEGGIFTMMEGLYSQKTNLDVYLKGYDGGALRINRKDRNKKPIILDAPALSIGLAVQPNVLKDLTQNKRFLGCGLVGRFLFAVPNTRLGSRVLQDAKVPEKVVAAYHRIITMAFRLLPLHDINGGVTEHLLRFSPRAYEHFNEFYNLIETQLGDGGELENMREWAGKLLGNTARIAGIWHGLMHLETEGGPGAVEIGEATVVAAVRLAQAYLIPHARIALFDLGSDPKTETAKRIVGWIVRNSKEEFSQRDVYINLHRSVEEDKGLLDDALGILVEHNYIVEVNPRTKKTGRKPTPKYRVNPAVHGQ